MRKEYRARMKIERSKAQKAERQKRLNHGHSYEEVFTFRHFVKVLGKCLKGVGWKASVQNYQIHALLRMYKDYLTLMNRTMPRLASNREIKIYERGKERIITPIHISDRVVQKVLCDYALTPSLTRRLIYDNGASLKGKGVLFSRNRMMEHLATAIRKFGTNFYVLSFDFKSYFDSIPHKTCRCILDRYISDRELVEIAMQVVRSSTEGKIRRIVDRREKDALMCALKQDELRGISLGSQVSQVMALVAANDIDHRIKDGMGFRYYVRYMDDGIVLGKTKAELRFLLDGIRKAAERLGLKLNERKTHITHIKKGFTFLKVRYFITNTGKVVRKLHRSSIVKMRRKLKKFKTKVERGEMTLGNVRDSFQSWLAHSKVANSYRTVKSMKRLYWDLFGAVS